MERVVCAATLEERKIAVKGSAGTLLAFREKGNYYSTVFPQRSVNALPNLA